MQPSGVFIKDREIQPIVTIITPVFNTSYLFTIELIESILANKYSCVEHIIIDDGSQNKENFNKLVDWIVNNNYECKLISNIENLGICKSINIALAQATGKYCCFCGDDILLPLKLSKEVEFLEQHNEVSFYYGDAYLKFQFQPDDDILTGSFVSAHRGLDIVPDSSQVFDHILTEGSSWIPIMAGMFRMSDLNEVNGMDEDLKFEDLDLHLRLAQNKKYVFSKEYHAIYRITSENSHRNKAIINEFELVKIYSKHLSYRSAILLTKKYFLGILSNKDIKPEELEWLRVFFRGNRKLFLLDNKSYIKRIYINYISFDIFRNIVLFRSSTCN